VTSLLRRRSLLGLLALGVTLGANAGGERPPEPAKNKRPPKSALALQETFASVAEKVFPSVVCLTSFERTTGSAPPEDGEEGDQGWREAIQIDQRHPGMRRLASASGFVMTADGYVLTTLDFLKKPDGGIADLVDAETPEGPIALCEVVGTEPSLNLAVIKLVAFPGSRPPTLEPVTIADHEEIRVGHWAIAVGDPLGPQRVFAAGLVSARPERDCYQADIAATFLEASLQVHPEAYGGPLVDLNGAVMGMIVPHRAGPLDEAASGLVYALPMSVATGIFESLKVARSFASPWLGVSVLSLAEYRARARAEGIGRDQRQPVMGVYIDNVFDPSPAALAGLRIGDILVNINGAHLSTVYEFQRSLYLAGIGNEITIDFYRDGEMVTHEVTLEGRPAEADTATTN
jgi:serine protease Do